ncbi:Fe-S cluster assembly protein SufD [Klebsiella pneumoniae]
MMPASSLRGCRLLLASALLAAVPAFAAPATVAPAKIQVSPAIDAAVKASTRDANNVKRDGFRHPAQTLSFFKVAPEKTVIEITPGNGWYSEILAPLLHDKGHYVAAVVDPMAVPEGRGRDYQQRSRDSLEKKYAGAPAQFGKTAVVAYDPAKPVFGPANSADVVLTFRNVHNWRKAGQAQGMFQGFFNVLKPGGVLGVVEHRLSVGDSAHLDNTVLHAHVARDGVLKHARVQAGSARQTSFLRTDAVLARDAQYHRVDLELGAALSRHELNVRLEGDNAQLTANGVLLGNGRRHVETRLGIDHIARDTSCELLWRGVAANRSRVVFHGGIQIREGADGTDANLSNKNLLLSADAEIDTQPTLVIDADEVKAAHGATVGQLDANALFYLRSRGLPQAQAQALLSAAFCHEPLKILPEALREQLARRLDKALAEAGVA